MSTRKADHLEDLGAGPKRTKGNCSSNFPDKNYLEQMQFLLQRMTLPASALLDAYAKQFKLVAYSVAMNGIHKTLGSIEMKGSPKQREWAAELRKALRDPAQTKELRDLFKRRPEDAQDDLADSIIVGTSSVIESTIEPVLESVGKRILAKTASSSS
ncbi:hypothetical protein BGX31_005646, partial [Mortierella sp. GBA43]